MEQSFTIYDDLCVGCALCVPICPTEALTDKKTYLNVDGYIQVKKVDIYYSLFNCIFCGLCEDECPTGAIDVDSGGSSTPTNPTNPGGDGDGGGDGNGGGGTANPGNDDNEQQQEELCEKAQQPSADATDLSKTNTFLSSSDDVSSFNDGNEHGVVFGSVNGAIVSTLVQHGGPTSLTLSHSFAVPVASLHYHTGNTPPSTGDVYSLMNAYSNSSSYNTYYVQTPNGTIYALTVTDPAALALFLQNHPANLIPNPNGGNFVNFPTDMSYEYNDIYTYYNGTQEMALAFILDKYDAGVALTKMDNNGDFKKLGTKETINGDNKSYEENNCD